MINSYYICECGHDTEVIVKSRQEVAEVIREYTEFNGSRTDRGQRCFWKGCRHLDKYYSILRTGEYWILVEPYKVPLEGIL